MIKQKTISNEFKVELYNLDLTKNIYTCLNINILIKK